ncbi:MAG: 4-oxalomesaconate tautomerase [SAR324 cluster bacterium]|nr:4-oxalomesaconate tautomerase [SAR324 cluster bacterium]
MQTAIPACLMRGGTSKGLIFLAEDLPDELSLRDQVLLAAMGSPDVRQIDGMGGTHPLTSKVGVISKSTRSDADVDYLFLQVVVDKAEVSDSQNCGNILAAVGPYALEKGLLEPQGDLTEVRIHMVNTTNLAIAQVQTLGGEVNYEGEARIDGVPGTAAPVLLDFLDTAGSSCGALLPTGRACDEIDGLQVTCIDNGMPVVLIAARDLGKTGYESPSELEADSQLKSRVESIRLQAGALMNLGDVTTKTVPKMSLVAPAQQGGVIATRTFIPHQVHEAIGVLGAVSVASACVLPGSVAQQVTGLQAESGRIALDVEHPTGFFTVGLEVEASSSEVVLQRAGLLRTARMLMRGEVLVPKSIWDGK